MHYYNDFKELVEQIELPKHQKDTLLELYKSGCCDRGRLFEYIRTELIEKQN